MFVGTDCIGVPVLNCPNIYNNIPVQTASLWNRIPPLVASDISITFLGREREGFARSWIGVVKGRIAFLTGVVGRIVRSLFYRELGLLFARLELCSLN